MISTKTLKPILNSVIGTGTLLSSLETPITGMSSRNSKLFTFFFPICLLLSHVVFTSNKHTEKRAEQTLNQRKQPNGIVQLQSQIM